MHQQKRTEIQEMLRRDSCGDSKPAITQAPSDRMGDSGDWNADLDKQRHLYDRLIRKTGGQLIEQRRDVHTQRN